MQIAVLYVGSSLPTLPRDTIRRPSWEQIEAAIRALDGHARCDVSVTVDDETYLLLGGGADDQYVCEVVVSHGDFILCDPTRPDGDLLINNGQPSRYERGHVVGLAAVLRATRHFADKGEPAPTLVWDRY